MSEHLRVHDDNGIRILTIDRPEFKNALNGPLRSELCAAVSAADRDDDVRVVVLTAVDPVFSAGVDFKQLERGQGETGRPLDVTPASALRTMRVRSPRGGAELLVHHRLGAGAVRGHPRDAGRGSNVGPDRIAAARGWRAQGHADV